MTCENKLGNLSCQNAADHIGGPERRGCVFHSTASSAYDSKEANQEGVGNGS